MSKLLEKLNVHFDLNQAEGVDMTQILTRICIGVGC